MLPYSKRIEASIMEALRNSPCTFEEIIRKCFGVYPTLVKNALDELNVHSSLVPLYSTQESTVPLLQNTPIDFSSSKIVTYQIENNPVLSNWYFSWHTCKKLSQLDLWQNKNILFLGTPRLFEFFALTNIAKSITLIDYDKTVTSSLSKLYGHIKNITIINADINFLGNTLETKYDNVFFDPPWYLDSYISWLITASKLVANGGTLIFPLFPYLVRPSASQERDEIFQLSRKLSKNVFLIPEYIEYDIPSFEESELKHSGIHLRANWKVSDLVIMQGVKYVPNNWDNVQVNTDYRSWKEYNWFGIRWFVREGKLTDSQQKENEPLISLFDNSIYLDSPSRQNKKIKLANVLSSKGHGFIVSNSCKFVYIMNQIANISSSDPETLESILQRILIDENSKKIFMTLKDEIYG